MNETNLSNALAAAAAPPHALNIQRLRAMLSLAANDEGWAEMTVVANAIGLTTAAMTGLADGLCTRGLAVRRTSEGDRRKINLSLTDAGRDLVAEILAALRA